MHLSTARVCLDCEEVHDSQRCPVCASESFAYLSRWVPSPEGRTQRPRPPDPGEAAQTYRQILEGSDGQRGRWLGAGAAAVAAAGVLGWIWKRSTPGDPDVTVRKASRKGPPSSRP
jgi:hypothetical protein